MSDDVRSEVARLAGEAVDMLQDRADGLLDYTPASLAPIDEILGEASRFVHELPKADVTTIVQRVGCYVLEVAHRQFGGAFFWHEAARAPVLVVGEPRRRIALVTWGKVRGRLSGDAADDLAFFYAGFAERAERAPDGTQALVG